jgi:hypothetical protein
LVLAGNDRYAINGVFQNLLEGKLSGGRPGIRGSREKTITILMKTWLTVPTGLGSLRDDGLELIKALPREDHICVHWGMLMAVYPFWGAVAAHTGRLLRLQGTATALHIQRRVREQYGERQTASRATQRVLRSFIDWGVLSETHNKGVYAQGKQYSVHDTRLIAWMAEASLHARADESAVVKDLLESPSIFPFRLAYVSAEQLDRSSPRLNILRHGLDDSLVMLGDKV